MPLPARTEFMTGEASLRGLRCAEALYPEGLRLPRHVHQKASVTVVAAGSLAELQGRGARRVECRSGAVVARPAGEPHGNEVGAGGVVNLELEVEPALLAGHGLSIVRPAVRWLPSVEGLASRLRRAMRRCDGASELLVEGLALEILACLFPALAPQAERSPPAWLLRAHDRIRSEFRSNLTMAQLAREARVHPVHLARAFRGHFGTSPGALLRALRLRWVAEELTGGDRPIASIAAEAGFCDQSHLTRAFHAAMGTAPAAYRRQRARRWREAP